VNAINHRYKKINLTVHDSFILTLIIETLIQAISCFLIISQRQLSRNAQYSYCVTTIILFVFYFLSFPDCSCSIDFNVDFTYAAAFLVDRIAYGAHRLLVLARNYLETSTNLTGPRWDSIPRAEHPTCRNTWTPRR